MGLKSTDSVKGVEIMFPKLFAKARGKPAADSSNSSSPAESKQGSDDETSSLLSDGAPDDGQNGRRKSDSLYPEDWSDKFECMGELVVEKQAGPADIVRVYRTLNEDLKAEVFYVNPNQRGTSIVCGVLDAGSFLGSIPKMPKVASWALTHR